MKNKIGLMKNKIGFWLGFVLGALLGLMIDLGLLKRARVESWLKSKVIEIENEK